MFTPVMLVVCGIGVEPISPGLAAGMNKACRQSYIIIINRFDTALFSALEQTHCARM